MNLDKPKAKVLAVETHLKENKKVYIAGLTCFVIGGFSAFLATRDGVQVVDSMKLIHVQYKSPNVVNVEMIRPGPKAFVLQCKETQQVWPSLRAAAKDLGLNPSELSRHLSGAVDSVQGKTFEKLGEI